MFSFIKNLFGISADLKQLLSKGAAIIDVRTKTGFETEHISGSKNIPLDKKILKG